MENLPKLNKICYFSERKMSLPSCEVFYFKYWLHCSFRAQKWNNLLLSPLLHPSYGGAAICWNSGSHLICYLRHFVEHKSCCWNNAECYFCVVCRHVTLWLQLDLYSYTGICAHKSACTMSLKVFDCRAILSMDLILERIHIKMVLSNPLPPMQGISPFPCHCFGLNIRNY